MTDSLSIAVHAFANHMLMSVSVDEVSSICSIFHLCMESKALEKLINIVASRTFAHSPSRI